MDIYASDEEKAEEIKRWWRENGLSVVLAVVLGTSAFFAGRAWLGYQQAQSLNAASLYQQVNMLLREEQFDDAEAATQQLINNFRRTPYATFAAIELAGQAVAAGQLSTGQQYLQWAVDNAKLSGHVEIARLRLARLMLQQGDFAEALALTENYSQGFASLYAELRGDIYAAQGENAQAQQAYQAALSAVAVGEPRQGVLEIKLDDVASANEG